MIVGGGPVGLTLACLLTLCGVDCVVLERRVSPAVHSRAIGIHPPALHVLEAAGVAGELTGRGVCIPGGRVYLDRKLAGRLPLGVVDPIFPFVLSVPQTVTEAVLERRLCELAPAALVRGATATGSEYGQTHATLTVETDHGTRSVTARYVVACDGKNSASRRSAGIPFVGGTYPDCYLMGDFADDTPFGTDAALFVTRGGIVESFPLPGGLRRWVARLPERTETSDARDLAALVYARTGFMIPVETCVWMSPFGIEYWLASTFYKGRLFLAGDAAHIVSPIGGQGMNLGFLDAGELASVLPRLLAGGSKSKETEVSEPTREAIRHTIWPYQYENARMRPAKTALARAERNTVLGRPCPPWHPYRALVWAMANIAPIRRHYAGVFTMRGLGDRG